MSNLYLSKVLAMAKDQLGYKEKASNSQLDDKTANAGTGNWTKYGRDLVNWIGGPYGNGSAWCDYLFDWIIISASDIARAKQALNGWSGYCPTSAAYYRSAGRWHSTPAVGDQFFLGTQGHETHTGLVIAVNGSTLTTIEGNEGNMVASETRTVASCSGFGRPDYDAEEAATPTPAPTSSSENGTYTVQKGDSLWAIAQKLLGNGSRYTEIKTLNSMTSDLILPGQVLKIPGNGETTYTVQRGDSLWAIAEKLLGSGARWKEIQTLNGMTSDLIVPGQKIKILVK